jgi:hypothetical protein
MDHGSDTDAGPKVRVPRLTLSNRAGTDACPIILLLREHVKRIGLSHGLPLVVNRVRQAQLFQGYSTIMGLDDLIQSVRPDRRGVGSWHGQAGALLVVFVLLGGTRWRGIRSLPPSMTRLMNRKAIHFLNKEARKTGRRANAICARCSDLRNHGERTKASRPLLILGFPFIELMQSRISRSRRLAMIIRRPPRAGNVGHDRNLCKLPPMP